MNENKSRKHKKLGLCVRVCVAAPAAKTRHGQPKRQNKQKQENAKEPNTTKPRAIPRNPENKNKQ